MTNMTTKKALILLDKSDCVRTLQMAEELCMQGYDLYAKGEMVHFFNKNMIPVSLCHDDMSFDVILK
ncbi:MAG: hypothetical protein IJD13_01325 [Oscillospiraceae bacterium]|nr:hypothetical protein [Oscillospiraceae bacterium]